MRGRTRDGRGLVYEMVSWTSCLKALVVGC